MRRVAILLRIHRTTVKRKLRFLSIQADIEHRLFLDEILVGGQKFTSFQFDEMETVEHTKMKPLSIVLAVDDRTRKILGFEVSQMPATGFLAEKARRKYGFRRDERAQGLRRLFARLMPLTSSTVYIRSDEKPLYRPYVQKYFPEAIHLRFKGRRGCVVGQGELKRGGFDPLFALNHTCAMLRANINRLFRRTWCTTKKREYLEQHLHIYVKFHNLVLT